MEIAGYKSQSAAKVPLEHLLTEKSVVNITNINIESNQLVIAFNLKIPTSQGAEFSIQNLDLDHEDLKV